MLDSCSQKVEIFLIAVLIFIAFCAPYPFWLCWAFAAFIAILILIVDLMFGDDTSFVYDPEPVHWKDLQEAPEFQFEADFTPKKEEKRKVY